LPEEAKIPELPLVTPYAGKEFATAYVTRGDMTLTEKINCTYSATKSERLSFGLGDEYYGSIFVEAGDYVEAGELVAELDISKLSEEIASVSGEIEKLEIELEEENKALDLALMTEELNGGGSTAASDAKRASIAYKESSLEILNEKKAELQQKIEARRLYAPISGTVTYVKKITAGMKSAKNENVVIITDMDSSVFIGTTANYGYFAPGQEVTVYSDGAEYAAVYTPAEQLGLEDKIDEVGRKTVYFAVSGSEAPAESGAKGTVVRFLDERKDALMIPSKAVFSIDDKTMVYYEDENGIKSAKEVVCGLQADGYTEITSGLSEGDCVIIG
jgi:multidrug efflux pump subunit AcrA (membrane-fusion protein)